MREFDLIAVLNGTHLRAPVAGLQMVQAVGMTAVLSTVPRPLTRLPQSRANQLQAAAQRLGLQEACMTLATLLPARQDCGLSLAEASAFLITNQHFLEDLMTCFAAKTQVQVTVTWNAAAVLQRFSHEPELSPLFAKGSIRPQDLTEAISRLAARLCGIMGAKLAEVSVAQAPLPVTGDVLWNGALLVPSAELPALDRAVEAIDAIWPDGLNIRQIGPAPVASFALLEVEPVATGQITAALGLLGLRTLADHRDMAAARRRLLMDPTCAPPQREAIRTAARIIEAAARLPDPAKGLHLCRIWAEGQAESRSTIAREVA